MTRIGAARCGAMGALIPGIGTMLHILTRDNTVNDIGGLSHNNPTLQLTVMPILYDSIIFKYIKILKASRDGRIRLYLFLCDNFFHITY